MFDRFVGIDWSGAKGPRQRGIQLSLARPGRAVPERVDAPDGRAWGRDTVFDWLLQTVAPGADAGVYACRIDFAFAHPFADSNAYYPGLANADCPALWKSIDSMRRDPHFYGGAVFANPSYGDYYCHRAAMIPALSQPSSPDRTCRQGGRARHPLPSRLWAQTNVATGSMAGMRLLHALKQVLGQGWPSGLLIRWCHPAAGAGAGRDFPQLVFPCCRYEPGKECSGRPAFHECGAGGLGRRWCGSRLYPARRMRMRRMR